MEEQKRNAQKIYNYISVANQIKNIDSDIYFFLKLYAKNLSMNVNLLPMDKKILIILWIFL